MFLLSDQSSPLYQSGNNEAPQNLTRPEPKDPDHPLSLHLVTVNQQHETRTYYIALYSMVLTEHAHRSQSAFSLRSVAQCLAILHFESQLFPKSHHAKQWPVPKK